MAGIITDEKKKKVVAPQAPILTPEQIEAARQNAAAAVTPAPAQTPETTTTTTTTVTESPAPAVTPAPEQTPVQEPAPVPDETRAALDEAYKTQITNFADLALQKKADIDAARAEDEQRERDLYKAAAWTGGTEFVSALANLIGVGSFKAANQQHQNFSKDWMAKADEARKTRMARRDNYRDQLNALNTQLSELKSGRANALANYDYKKKQQDIAEKKADAYSAYQLARVDYQDALTALTQAKAEFEKTKSADAQQKLDIAQQNADTAAKRAETARLDYERKLKESDATVEVKKSQVRQNDARTNYYNKKAGEDTGLGNYH